MVDPAEDFLGGDLGVRGIGAALCWPYHVPGVLPRRRVYCGRTAVAEFYGRLTRQVLARTTRNSISAHYRQMRS